MSEVTQAPEAEVKAPKKKADKSVRVVANVTLFEPFLNIRLPAGVEVEVPRLTNWIECQVEAGLATIVE